VESALCEHDLSFVICLLCSFAVCRLPSPNGPGACTPADTPRANLERCTNGPACPIDPNVLAFALAMPRVDLTIGFRTRRVAEVQRCEEILSEQCIRRCRIPQHCPNNVITDYTVSVNPWLPGRKRARASLSRNACDTGATLGCSSVHQGYRV
jgi:hypothetical protein